MYNFFPILERLIRILNNNNLSGEIPNQLMNCFSLISLWVLISILPLQGSPPLLPS